MPVASEAELSTYLIAPGEIDGAMQWSAFFGRDAEVEIEIGCGKGRFLSTRAESVPDRNLLGVDWGRPWLRRAAHRLTKAGIENVRLLRTDAKYLLSTLVPEESVSLLHVYFPDPWPKKRHHKRRLFDPSTTPNLERALKPGCQLHVATDRGDYFEVIRERIASDTELIPRPEMEALGATESNFAQKYRAEGRQIFQSVWEKRA